MKRVVLLVLLLVSSPVHAVNYPVLCGDATGAAGCGALPWGSIDWNGTIPTPCNYAGGYFVAGISTSGAFDCQLASGGGGTADCAGAPELQCLGGRAGGQTLFGGTVGGDCLTLGSESTGTPGVQICRNGSSLDRVLIGPGVDPVNALQFLVTNENDPTSGALFGAYYAGNDSNGAATFFGVRGRGTSAVPLHTDADDTIFNLAAIGFDSTNTISVGPPGFFITVKQAGAAAAGYVAMSMGIYTVDNTGTFNSRILINDDGTVTLTPNVSLSSNLALTGGSGLGYTDIGESDGATDPAAPAADTARVYARDNGAGKTQLVVRFATGAVQVLATQP